MEDIKPDFELTVKVDRKSDETVTIGLRELDEPTYIAVSKLMDAGKIMDAVRMMIINLRVSGVPSETITKNFQATRAALKPLLELIEPLDGSLKKN
jgi:hypothetical protein